MKLWLIKFLSLCGGIGIVVAMAVIFPVICIGLFGVMIALILSGHC